MTNEERKVIELALEALQFALHVGFPESSESQIKKGEKAYQQHRAAITAIKEALAQPDQDEVDIRSRLYQRIHELETQLAQPEQEPVKMVAYNCTCGRTMKFESVHGVVAPQRKPLTDEEIQELWESTASYYNVCDFAKAIEAAHGIKE